MATRLQFTGNYDADGNPETVDAELASGGVQTKKDFEDSPPAAPVRINPHAQGVQRVQFGAEAAFDEQMDDAQKAADLFEDDLDSMRSRISAGHTFDSVELERVQHRFNDLAIAYVRGGGGVNDDALVHLRGQVDAICAQARANRK